MRKATKDKGGKMKLTKEVLEKGVIIRTNGSMIKYSKRIGIQERELFVQFSKNEVKSEFEEGKTIIIRKTPQQAAIESILTHFYFSSADIEPNR